MEKVKEKSQKNLESDKVWLSNRLIPDWKTVPVTLLYLYVYFDQVHYHFSASRIVDVVGYIPLLTPLFSPDTSQCATPLAAGMILG